VSQKIQREGPGPPVGLRADPGRAGPGEQQVVPKDAGEKLRVAKDKASGPGRGGLLGLDLAPPDGAEVPGGDLPSACIPKAPDKLRGPRFGEVLRELARKRCLPGGLGPKDGDPENGHGGRSHQAGAAAAAMDFLHARWPATAMAM